MEINNSICTPLLFICIFTIILLSVHVAINSGKMRKAEKDIAVMKTVLIIKQIMPVELAHEETKWSQFGL